jgi:hypothetical protein
MTDEQKLLLEPFADLIHRMGMMLRERSPAELSELKEACKAVTGTNCWYATFDAAKIVEPEIDRILLAEKRARERRASAAP